ncbi:MAG: NAD(P)/FAD-dependent oxidoreductase, partial [Myxococcales bacterium]|nr:NAD(P)/FAD-dependent oxidoreductase [Myxococcales bacterium]
MSLKERLTELLQILPHFRLFWRTGATQMKNFSNKFKDQTLRAAFNYIFFQDPQTFPMLPFLYNMACAHNQNAGFPEGGSLGLSRSLEQRYLSLGGTIHYGSCVNKIVVEDNKAIGIKFKKGPPQFSDYIISAADAISVLYDYLDGHYINPTIDKLYKNVMLKPGILFPSVISVFFGIKIEIGKNEAHSTTYLLDNLDAKSLPGCQQNCIVIQHRSQYAQGFAPQGHSIIHCTYFSDFDYWQDLRLKDKKLYREKKSQVVRFLTRFLEQRYPQIIDNIEVVEVATPATTKRYTGNFRGSIFGFKAFSEAEEIAERLIDKQHMKLPGLKNFYMTGQWVLGGGLPRAALSGRYVAQFLCNDLKLSFNVSEIKNSSNWNPKSLGYLPKLD